MSGEIAKLTASRCGVLQQEIAKIASTTPRTDGIKIMNRMRFLRLCGFVIILLFTLKLLQMLVDIATCRLDLQDVLA